jgi:hypothetical protein
MSSYPHQRTQVQSRRAPRTTILLLLHARPTLRRQSLHPEGALKFPSLKDTAGVQSDLGSLATRRINLRHAGLYLQGLQRAAQLAVKFDDKPS